MAELFLASGGSGGIGAALCVRLAEAGYRPLVGYARNEPAGHHVARRCGGEAVFLDLESDGAIDEVIGRIARADEPLAGVALAASPPPSLAPFGKIDAAEMQRQWRVNVLGPQRLLSGLVRNCMRRRRSGIVVGVLTRAMGDEASKPATGMGAYIVAKHGLAGLLAVAAAEYPWLRVRTVRPGYTETRMLAAFDGRFLAQQRLHQPFQTPDEVADQIMSEIGHP